MERDHTQSNRELLRRRLVVAVVLILGATVLGISLSVRPGDSSFYFFTMVLAAIWAVGGLISGPLHLGYIPFRGKLRRPLVTPIVTGLLIGAVFVVGALLVREIEPLRDYVDDVLAHAYRGAIVPIAAIAVVNAVTEEIFFRGALFAAIGRT
ncbi:MAG: CPBP family intramembrane metalloprotease, partial [Longispora sp.]|nr:CPBP family intramembrane metalloprotease [Longispora sp. (in: high G+C Gram-positive bacteria)]